MASKNKKYFSKYGLRAVFTTLSFAIFGAFHKITQAQVFGNAEVETGLGGALQSGDPRIMVGRIIQILLGFLGVIAVTLLIYAGFLWMSSGGDDEKVRRAKQILKNAVIGLAIILSSWAITIFILTRLFGATTGDMSFRDPSTNKPSFGLGAIGACSIESVYPENGQRNVPRNTSIVITFKEALDLKTVCADVSGQACACGADACNLLNPEAIRIFKEDLGDACGVTCPDINANSNETEVLVSISADHKTILMSPLNYLGVASRDTKYRVKLSSDLKKENGHSMFVSCSNTEFEWGFEVSNKLDLNPPQVVSKSLFPRPDNEADAFVGSEAVRAEAKIAVNTCPKIYHPATIKNVQPNTEVSLDYHGPITKFKVAIPSDTNKRAQLFNGNNNTLLGIADINTQGDAIFTGFLTINVGKNPESGSLWTVDIEIEQLADYLQVGNIKYFFAESDENNNIEVPSNCNTNQQAINIQNKLNGHLDVNIQRNNDILNLSAKVAGSRGNDLVLESSNHQAFNISPFAGGSDASNKYDVKDAKDVPMNSIIKIGFNEAINPIHVSGLSSEVSDYIRIINADAGSLSAGSFCTNNSDCRSYKCENNACVGDQLKGRFNISSNYKTVEFISDNECGLNSCGEKIYCLPAGSNLLVQIKAANLKSCNGDLDCSNLNPYNKCGTSSLSYKTCQDPDSNNYPLANILNLDGIVDMAFNSLDANRDGVSAGPLNYFNENQSHLDRGDNFQYSFFVSDRMEVSIPEITSIFPNNNQVDIPSMSDPVELSFNALMMHSSLRTGSINLPGKNGQVNHKLINLRTDSTTPLGYWIGAEDFDSEPLDGIFDKTKVSIKHSIFLESVAYGAQVGSGVKDVYQNCYKPSSGPNCVATPESPSCCFGQNTSSLDKNGSCIFFND